MVDTNRQHAAYVDQIVKTYRAASGAQVAQGQAWYPHAGRIIDGIAEWSGLDRHRTAALVAALSPRNPWAWNVQDAAAYAYAAVNGQDRPTATTFNQNQTRAWQFATGDADWSTSAPKVRSFVANMTGDQDAVTVDVWAVRVATDGARHEVRSDRDYHEIAEAYRAAAEIVGDSPRNVQAVTWLVAQAAGTGSHRRGRHDMTLKRGTFAIVAQLLAA